MCLMGAATVPPARGPLSGWGRGPHVAGGRDRLPSRLPIIHSGRWSHASLSALAHLGAAWEAAVLTQWQRKMSKKKREACDSWAAVMSV